MSAGFLFSSCHQEQKGPSDRAVSKFLPSVASSKRRKHRVWSVQDLVSRQGCAGALLSPWWGAGQPLSPGLALHWQELHILESWSKFAARVKSIPKLESSYELCRQTCCAALMSCSFCDDGKVSPLTQQVGLVLCLLGLGWNLCFPVPASLTQGGTVTETFMPRPSTCPALSRPILTLTHHWNLQLLPGPQS